MKYPINVQSDSVTIRDESFVGNGNQGLLVPNAEQRNFGLWRFVDCVFDGVAVELSRVGAVGPSGKPESRGTGLTHDVVFERCLFRNCRVWATLRMAGVEGITISNCIFEDCGVDETAGDAIKCSHGTHDVLITGNRIRRITRDGVDVFDANRVTIRDNVIHDCGGLGVDAKASPPFTNDTRGHIINENRIRDCRWHGVGMLSGGAQCIGNDITGCEYGILVADPYPPNTSGSIVRGNQCYGNRTRDIADYRHALEPQPSDIG